jgi:hypothetical protein
METAPEVKRNRQFPSAVIKRLEDQGFQFDAVEAILVCAGILPLPLTAAGDKTALNQFKILQDKQ